MGSKVYGLLEFGSNSLKFHRLETVPGGKYHVTTTKIPWAVSHTYYSRGELDEEISLAVIHSVLKLTAANKDVPPGRIVGIATGVFRDLPDFEGFAARIRGETGVRARLISGDSEARLMAEGFDARRPGRTVICDLGGSTTEWALFDGTRRVTCGSLRLGTIRNLYAAKVSPAESRSFLDASRRLCDEQVGRLSIDGACDLLATGGTARALATCQGTTVSLEGLREFIQQVAHRGPPSTLSPGRQKLLLPGLVILERFATRCGSTAIEYAQSSVGSGLVERLLHVATANPKVDIRATLLLYSSGTGRRGPS
jgi:exopolyphosphatase/pppGpp-phosphohydrolase